MTRLQAKASSAAADECAEVGVYCHVPFCASSCEFCAFYQEQPDRAGVERYLAGMEREFAALPERFPARTVFWGGGTPGLLSAGDMARLGEALLARLEEPPAEWTVEMAPSTVKADKLRVLRDLGVTRISMGAQSFRDRFLEAIGRRQGARAIYRAWDLIRRAEFPETNIDLMFALPGQTVSEWEADLREVARLAPTHVSTYALTFEEDTALYAKLARGEVTRDEAAEIAMYERGWSLLPELGYPQYEISNFARPGSECRHNRNIWRMGEWVGLGPSAASQFRGERYQRPSDTERWANGLENGRPERLAVTVLDDSLLWTDAVVFGLRTNAGVDLRTLSGRFPEAATSMTESVVAELRRMEAEGLVVRESTRIRPTHRGRLLADAIGTRLLFQCAE